MPNLNTFMKSRFVVGLKAYGRGSPILQLRPLFSLAPPRARSSNRVLKPGEPRSLSLALCLLIASAMVLTVGCSEDDSTPAADNGGSTEPTVEVVLGDSERGASDGIGQSARFEGLTAMCALTPERVALSDTFAGTLRLLDLQTSEVTTLTGSPEEPGVADGPLPEARFSSPRGIGCLPGGTGLLVADNGALRHIDLEAGQVTTVAGRPGVPGYEDGSAVRARFGYLIHAIAVTPDGRTAFLSDRSNDAIRAVDLQTYEVRTVSGPDAGWSGPGGLAFDPSETSPTRVWVADTFSNRLRGLDLATGDIVELGSTEAPQGIVIHEGAAFSMGFGETITRTVLASGISTEFSAGFGGTFSSPLIVDNELLYAELARGSVRALLLDTRIDRLVAGPEQPRGNIDGNGPDVRFEQITDLVAAQDGSWAIIADAGNSALRRARFKPDAPAVVDTVTVPGLDIPVGLALSDEGKLAIVDYGAGTVIEMQIDATGELSSHRVRAEGLESPWGVAWGNNGELFVAEIDGARITRIAPDDAASVHAGSGESGTSDGTALEASFSAPVAIVPGAEGMLILDIAPGAIRWSDFATSAVSTLSGGTDVNEPANGSLEAATWVEPSRAVALDKNTWLVVDRVPGTLRLLERDTTGGRVSTVAGSPRRSGGLPAGATVPLSQAALGSAAALAVVEGAWLVATDTAVLRIEGDVLAPR